MFSFTYANTYLIILLMLLNIFAVRTECDWTCDNNECIDSEYLCDGMVQCRDGSDETIENCYTNSTCPSYAFRCAYGACIEGANRCNGKQDCADNSDEVPFVCKMTRIEMAKTLQGKCGDTEIQCDTGECIDSDRVCDGVVDCPKSYDESLETCSSFACQPFAFRCAYGACIEGKAACNGTTECHDGSDESFALCGGKRKIATSRPSTTTDSTSTTSTTTIKPPTTTPNQEVKGLCEIPSSLGNVIIRDVLRDVSLSVGTKVPTNTVVRFSCQPGFTLFGEQLLLCMSYGWKDVLPTCTKYCNETMLFEGVSTRATCYYENRVVPCKNIRPGTSAIITCETGYQQKNIRQETTLHCQNDYTWDHPKTPCEIRCGYVQQPSTAFANDGIEINITKAPWHVGVYNKLNEKEYKRNCGGSVVSTRLVVSAAHCFWDEANAMKYPERLFKIVPVTIIPLYNDNEGMDVADIHIPTEYTGFGGNYYKDLAIVKLVQPFKFSASIQPICVENRREAAAAVESNTPGFIVGWGPTDTNQITDVFQKVIVNTLSYSHCSTRLPEYELPSDKFCVQRAGSKGDICRGDSGGGFVWNHYGRYYLFGVISHAPLKRRDCGKDGFVALTNVHFYDIKQYILDDEDRIARGPWYSTMEWIRGFIFN